MHHFATLWPSAPTIAAASTASHSFGRVVALVEEGAPTIFLASPLTFHFARSCPVTTTIQTVLANPTKAHLWLKVSGTRDQLRELVSFVQDL